MAPKSAVRSDKSQAKSAEARLGLWHNGSGTEATSSTEGARAGEGPRAPGPNKNSAKFEARLGLWHNGSGTEATSSTEGQTGPLICPCDDIFTGRAEGFGGPPSGVCFLFCCYFTCITEAERKQNGSRTEATMICGEKSRRAFSFRLHNGSRTEAERKQDGSKIKMQRTMGGGFTK